ncbi:MAG: hypothetical protein Q8L86_19515 [Vicinamibacterales bacterium]|nr:hypothetical protein [Vicinamibacterales bacterium]
MCAEFTNLGDAIGFPPEALNPNADIDRVVLALALICNDMNDAFSILERMNGGASASAGPTPYEGARAGRRGWATRLIASITHEALETLKAHETLLSSHDEVHETLATMTDKNVVAWNALMALALEPGKEPRRQFLVRVRNNVSYHYADAKPLALGYQRVFIDQEKTAFNRWAYVSAGDTFAGLRFYFADAAAGEAVQAAVERATEDSKTELTEVAAMTVNGLFNFVLKFMNMRVTKVMGASR